MQRKIGLVVIDDQEMTRIGLAALLQPFDDIVLLDTAESLEQALAVCTSSQPNVVLIEPLIGRRAGLRIIRALHERWPGIGIVALSSLDDSATIEQALQAGAISYLIKNSSGLDLAQAIRRARRGQATLAPQAAQALVDRMQRPKLEPITFTEREREVLTLLAYGHSNQEIAARLFVAPATVKGHVRAILAKLDVATRPEAIARIWGLGLVAPPRPELEQRSLGRAIRLYDVA